LLALYINNLFANIKIVLVVINSLIISLIFPIFLKINIIFNDKQKLMYNIKLFSLVKVIGGEIGLLKEGIVIHLTKRKAIIIEYKDIVSIRKKFEPVKDFHFISFNSNIKIGDNNFLLLIKLAYSYMFFINIIERIIKINKPYLDLDNSITIYENKDVFEMFCKINLVFNILVILISLIKIFMEKKIYAIKRRAKQN